MDDEAPEQLGDIPAVPADFQPAPPAKEAHDAYVRTVVGVIMGLLGKQDQSDLDLPNVDVSAK